MQERITQPSHAGRGRRTPPRDGLTGRTGACRILQCDRRTLRRMEERGIVQPALVEPDGVRWFDVERIRLLAAAMQKAARVRDRRAHKAKRPHGVEPCTGAETQQINAWIAAGLDHAEIVSRSGKTNETIRYLYAQYITPHGRKLRSTLPDPAREEDYFPELSRRPRTTPARPLASATPPDTRPTSASSRTPVSAEWFREDRSGQGPEPPRRPVAVPAAWFEPEGPDALSGKD